jgi:hypothetical protein
MSKHPKANAIGIIINTIIILFTTIPAKIYIWIGVFTTIGSFVSLFFDYQKADPSNFINSINWVNILIIILCATILLLFVGFLKYILESEDLFRFTLEQKERQALFLSDSIIQNLICELENYIAIKHCNFADEYFYTTGMKLTDSKCIEITAKSNGFRINDRMIFEVMKKKSIEDTYAYDPLGLAIVYTASPESFKSILIDTNPCKSYWEIILKNLKKTEVKNENIYLKTYVPTSIKYSDENDLEDISNKLKKL